MPVEGSVRVLVVDDSESTREMLREALSLVGSVEVVGEAGSGREAVLRAAEVRPDVVLMDVRMPDGDGAAACRAIVADRPETRVLALTWSDDPATLRDMITAGAIGYIVKGGTIDELVAAIQRASAGEPGLDQRMLPAAVEDLRRLLEQERERREQAERLSAARAEFVQVLSHELRTPLTVISGALQMMKRGGVRPEDAELVESGLRRVADLEFLVEGLELVASGATPFGLALPKRAVTEAAERAGGEPDTTSVTEEPWHGVPGRYVHRVAFELMSNALKHGRRPIHVGARRDSAHGVLTITDAGGWSPPGRDFGAFFQEDMTATRGRGGLGLGLFLASRLCRACDGELSVQAEDGKTVARATFRLRGGLAPLSQP
jgi:DNA-binding NarL/FixJ family response regulator